MTRRDAGVYCGRERSSGGEREQERQALARAARPLVERLNHRPVVCLLLIPLAADGAAGGASVSERRPRSVECTHIAIAQETDWNRCTLEYRRRT